MMVLGRRLVCADAACVTPVHLLCSCDDYFLGRDVVPRDWFRLDSTGACAVIRLVCAFSHPLVPCVAAVLWQEAALITGGIPGVSLRFVVFVCFCPSRLA
jgi:hypothetical protein